jgi:uncharacterized phage protein (TIGR01671 family)
VYGYLIHDDVIRDKGIAVGTVSMSGECEVSCDGYRIIPETVGQFTGLLDSKGKEIYEGDVFFILSAGRKCFVHYRDKAASFALYGNGKISLNEAYWFETDVKNSEVEIIGNIHDNPDLLTVK